MADIVDDCRDVARTLEGWGRVTGPGDWIGQPSVIAAHLTRIALEVENLRKEVKLLKARNASLVWRLVWVLLIFAGSVCGTFMAVFLSR